MTMTANDRGTEPDVPVAEDPDMGGSPGDFRADDIDDMVPEDANEGSQDDGDEPESDGDPGVPDASQQRISQLESELAERARIIDQIGEEMERDPEFAQRVGRIGRGAATSSEDLANSVRSVIDEALEPSSAAAMSKVMEPVLQRLMDLEKRYTGMAPRLDTISKEVGSRQFSESLDVHGVPASVQRSDGFQAHLRSLRGKPEFQRLQARSPAFAAEYAADKWNLSRATKNGHADERSRISAAKNGRSARRAPGSPSLADQIVKIKRQPYGGHLEQAKQVRFEAARKGREIPKIVYED